MIRRKRSGTFADHPRAQFVVMENRGIQREVSAQGLRQDWRFCFAAQRPRTVAERHLSDVPEAGPLRHLLVLKGLLLAQGVPICLETRAIDPHIVPLAQEQDFSSQAPGQRLSKAMPCVPTYPCR
ncbi:MAG: UTRA domain-containing protein [Paracoccus denitrificans]|uniref:UTRA domain-containing protein n=1 Tax=Paracoccus denitrificans TaxID=266 RepID=A0A533I727_PARDE|nr:MAG: UTRA domain-containing protein [Paracoccus denitrificans]